MPAFSIIVPVYNRPEELNDLLDSLAVQTFKDFEVIIVDDGSEIKSEQLVSGYAKDFQVRYIYKENEGPGLARNAGAGQATGRWLLFLDSDCFLPVDYMEIVNRETASEDFDSFGGPDRPHHSFNVIQKAIGYAMSSVLTTGGIRGAAEKFDIFYPRSFNLGVRNSVFCSLNGFSSMRFGEDLDFSMRLLKKGYSSRLIKDAFVYHKRRKNLRAFFKQVYNSGIARINLELRHKGTLKLVHCLPTLFVLGHLAVLLASLCQPWLLLLLVPVPLIVFFHSLRETKELHTACWAVPAVFTQNFGYGLGFLEALIVRKMLKQKEFQAFSKNFYK